MLWRLRVPWWRHLFSSWIQRRMIWPKQTYIPFEEEAKRLADISDLIQDIELRPTIISVYETQATKVGRLFRRETGILVEKDAAETRSWREECFGLSANQSNLYTLGKSHDHPDQPLLNWIRYMVCKDQVNFMKKRLRAYFIGSSEVAASVIVSNKGTFYCFIYTVKLDVKLMCIPRRKTGPRARITQSTKRCSYCWFLRDSWPGDCSYSY